MRRGRATAVAAVAAISDLLIEVAGKRAVPAASALEEVEQRDRLGARRGLEVGSSAASRNRSYASTSTHEYMTTQSDASLSLPARPIS